MNDMTADRAEFALKLSQQLLAVLVRTHAIDTADAHMIISHCSTGSAFQQSIADGMRAWIDKE